METSLLPAYEEILCGDHDGEDGWWFLRSDIEKGQIAVAGSALGNTLEGKTDTELKDTSVGATDVAINVADPPPALGDRETSLIDGICSKYKCGEEFRADLLRLVLVLLSLPRMVAVSAEGDGTLTSPDYHSVTITNSAESLLSYCMVLLGFLFALILSPRAHDAASSVFNYVRGLFGIRVVEDSGDKVMDTVGQQEESHRRSTSASAATGLDIGVVDEGLVTDEVVGPSDEDARGRWKEWYDNLSEEGEHNLECWSPK